MPDEGRTKRLVTAGVAGVVLLAGIAFLFSRVGGTAETEADSTTTDPTRSSLVVTDTPLRPERVQINENEGGGGQLVTWSTPGAQEGDQYRVNFTDGPAELRDEQRLVSEAELSLDTRRHVCVSVSTVRGSTVSDASQEVCSR